MNALKSYPFVLNCMKSTFHSKDNVLNLCSKFTNRSWNPSTWFNWWS